MNEGSSVRVNTVAYHGHLGSDGPGTTDKRRQGESTIIIPILEGEMMRQNQRAGLH